MKQRLFAILIALVALPLAARAAGSATFEASPSARTVDVGERFTVNLVANPNGESLDTARAYVNFSEDLLRVEGVELGSLFPRQAPGNGFDNAAGTVSEGGFVLGSVVTQSGVFATITFTSLKEGTATIEVADNSRLIAGGEEKGSGAYADATVTVRGAEEEPAATPVITVTSITHPDQNLWNKNNDFSADWSVPEGANVTRWRTAFDQDPTSDPEESYASSNVTKTISDIADGVWYFHIKGELADGSDTQTAHYQVHVDQTIPNPIAPTTMRLRYLDGEDALIEFATTDDTSGIDRYALAVNDGDAFPVVSPYVLRDLTPGDYFISVAAYDKAGNMIGGKTGFRVYTAGTELKDEDITAREEEVKRIDALEEAQSESSEPSKNALLITIFLGLAAILGIISAISTRRRK